jgi:hypothetical protein
MAFVLFLTEYRPQNLPYAYIGIAKFGTLAAILSIKAAERVSFSTGLILNMAFWGLCSSLTHFGAFFWPPFFPSPKQDLYPSSCQYLDMIQANFPKPM